jgi:DNA-binding NarL/FixJ family response regulator
VNKGLKNKEVGERLFISETTVRHHLTTIFNKLEVRNRFELIDRLHRHKLANSNEKALFGSNRAK